jgi:hypothetical protein
MRNEADGPAQLDKGQSFLSQVENGLEADMKMLGHILGRPQIRILRRSFHFLGRMTEGAVIGWKIHRMVSVKSFIPNPRFLFTISTLDRLLLFLGDHWPETDGQSSAAIGTERKRVEIGASISY